MFLEPWTHDNVMTVLYAFPVFLLCLSGSVALLLHRESGYYCIYVAMLLILAFGTPIPFIPMVMRFAQPICDRNPFVMDRIIGTSIDAFVTGVLIWAHVAGHKMGITTGGTVRR